MNKNFAMESKSEILHYGFTLKRTNLLMQMHATIPQMESRNDAMERFLLEILLNLF